MSYCASCGAALPPGAVFCGTCGHRVGSLVVTPPPAAPVAAATGPATVALGPTPTPPPPPAPRRSSLVPVMVVLAILAIGIGVVVLATRDGKGSGSTAGSTTIVDGSTTTVLGSTTVASTAAPSTVPVDPATQLQQLVAGDLPTAKSLVGTYVPQLSAKKVGLTAGNITYGPAEILDDHLKLRSAYGAILVDGTAFQFTSGGTRMIGWFLTIVPKSFPTKAAATKWCTDQGLSSADCFGRMFSPPA